MQNNYGISTSNWRRTDKRCSGQHDRFERGGVLGAFPLLRANVTLAPALGSIPFLQKLKYQADH